MFAENCLAALPLSISKDGTFGGMEALFSPFNPLPTVTTIEPLIYKERYRVSFSGPF
jgi:hypothetical protein